MAGRIRFTPQARRDLSEIFRFTARKWSVDQANTYVAEINSAIRGLASGTTRSRPISERIPGFRQFRVRSHLVIHRDLDDSIEVVRVLHGRMDVAQHL